MVARDRQDVADFKTVVHGLAARDDRHVVVLRLAVVRHRAGDLSSFSLREINNAVVDEVARHIEDFVGRIRADDFNRFGLEALFVALRRIFSQRFTVRHGAAFFNRSGVPNRCTGVGVDAVNRQILALFIAGVDRFSPGLDGEVLIAGNAVVRGGAREDHVFGLRRVERAVVDVFAADHEGLVCFIAAVAVRAARVNGDRVPRAFARDDVRAARSDREVIARFGAVVRHKRFVDVFIRILPAGNGEIVPGRCSALFVRERSGHGDAFGLRRVDFAEVVVVARDLEERFAERIGTDDVLSALFDQNFVPDRGAGVRVRRILGNNELVTLFIALVERGAARGDRHVVVAREPHIGEVASHIRHVGFSRIESARVREGTLARDRKGIAFGIGADLEAFILFERRIERFARHGHLIPDRRTVVGPAALFSDVENAAFFIAVVGPPAERNRHVLVVRGAVVRERAREGKVVLHRELALFDVRNRAGQDVVRHRVDHKLAGIVDDGVDRGRRHLAYLRSAGFGDFDLAVVVLDAVSREVARNLRRAELVVEIVRVQDRAVRHGNRAFVLDVPHGELAVLRPERTVLAKFGGVDPAGRRAFEAVRAERDRAVLDVEAAAVSSVREEFVAVVVVRRPVEVVRTSAAHQDEFLAAFDADVVGIRDVLEADRVVDLVLARLRRTADHEALVRVARSNRVVVERRRIEHDARIKHPGVFELFLLFLERRRGVDREVAHEVAEEVLFNLDVFADHARTRERIKHRGDKLHRPVFVVPDDHAAVLEADAGSNFVLDVGDGRGGNYVRDDVDLARFRINGVDVDDSRRHMIEELIERGLDRTVRADRDRLIAGMCARRQIDVVDVKHAARTDVDDRVGIDRIDLDRHVLVGPVNLFGRRLFIKAFLEGERGRPVDVDRVLTEHAGGIAFVVVNHGRIKVTAVEVEGRVFEPPLLDVVLGRGRLREGNAFRIGEVVNSEAAAAHRDLAAFLAGELADHRHGIGTRRNEFAAARDRDRIARELRAVVLENARARN